MALLMQGRESQAERETLFQQLLEKATAGRLGNLDVDSPNLLLYSREPRE